MLIIPFLLLSCKGLLCVLYLLTGFSHRRELQKGMSEGFSEQDIQLAGFFVRAKPLARRFGVVLVFVIEAILIIVGLWYWGQWFGQARIDGMQSAYLFHMNAAPAVEVQRSVIAARPIEIQVVKVLDGAVDTKDYVAMVVNPNERWIANITYSFAGTAQTEFRRGSVLPGERRVLGVYGSELKMGSARFVIENIAWERIDRHEVEDVAGFVTQRDQVRVERVEYVNANADVTTDRVSFVLTNDSPYSFYSVMATAVMYVGESIAGVEQFEVSPFMSFDEQEVEVHSRPRGIKPTRVEVLTHVDVFDESAYIEVGGL